MERIEVEIPVGERVCQPGGSEKIASAKSPATNSTAPTRVEGSEFRSLDLNQARRDWDWFPETQSSFVYTSAPFQFAIRQARLRLPERMRRASEADTESILPH